MSWNYQITTHRMPSKEDKIVENKRIYLLAQFDRATEQNLTNIYNQLIQAGFCGKQTPNLPYHFTIGSFGACTIYLQ